MDSTELSGGQKSEFERASSMDDPMKVLIVDDQVLVREGLRELMKYWEEFEVVGEASNGQEAIEQCRKLSPDMVLMDVQMPIMNGLEATKVISSEFPQIYVIMLTVALDDCSLFGALRSGAKGYVLKDTPSRELRERLQGVKRGEFPLSGLAASRLVQQMGTSFLNDAEASRRESKTDYFTKFTPREIEILRLVAQGLSNAEIGAQLYLGAGTVKKHLSSIMQKLGLDNRVQVAIFAYSAGFLD